MNTKKIVHDLVEQSPDSVSLRDVARHIEFVAAVQDWLDELDRGEGIPREQIEAELSSWVIR